MFARAQTPRPPGKAGRYECIRRACEPSEPPDGWCGREAWRSKRGGAARRVSCVLWTLETLARCGGGGGPHPWRERWARGRAYRGGSGRMQRGFCRLGQGAWPGGDSRRVRGDAFLAPFRRSQRLRRLRSPQRRPMPQRAVKGQGPFDISERRPSPYRAQRGRPLTAAVRAKQLFSAKTVDKAKRWCYHSCKQRRRRQSRYESSTHGPQLRLLLYL